MTKSAKPICKPNSFFYSGDDNLPLIPSVLDEQEFRSIVHTILDKFILGLNLSEIKKNNLYKTLYSDIEDRYHQRINDKIKLKVFYKERLVFNPYDFEQFENDIREILAELDNRFMSHRSENIIPPNKKYTNSMFNYCINKKEIQGITFDKSSDEIPILWHLQSFNKSGFLRSLSYYYNNPRKPD